MKNGAYNSQNSFVIYKSLKGSSSYKDTPILGAQIFDKAEEKTLVPLVLERNVPISSIVAILPNGTIQTNLSLSKLISLMGDGRVKFKTSISGKETDISFYTDFVEKMAHTSTNFVPVVTMETSYVPVDRIYKFYSDGTPRQNPVKSVDELDNNSNFCFLDYDGNYYNIHSFSNNLLNELEHSYGAYVLVRLKGEQAHSACPIENLRLEDESGNPSAEKLSYNDFRTCAGKRIWAIGEDGKTTYELEPLTETEIATYDSRKVYQKTTNLSDICKDEHDPSKPESTAYLRLKNGKYVKEIDVVQPKCYNYASHSATKFDAYVVTCGMGEFKRSYIIDKSKIDSKIGDEIELNVGKEVIKFNKRDCQKVVRSNGGINNSDIIQTSSKGAVGEDCEILENRGIALRDGTLDEETRHQLAQRIKNIYADFLNKYKANQYDLGGELLIMDEAQEEGQFEEYLANHRYLLSDIMPMPDYTVSDLKEYLNMPADGFVFDGQKLVGGEQYDQKKARKNSYNKYWDVLGTGIASMVSGYPYLLLMASLPLSIAVAAATLGFAIGIPIYHKIKKSKIEAKKDYVYRNKIEHQNEKTKEEIFTQIEQIFADFKTTQPQFELSLKGLPQEVRNQKIQERKQLFLAEMALAETKIDLLSASKSGGQFDMIDGKGKVNQANAHEYSQYVKLLGKQKTEIENLTNQIKTTKAKIEELATVASPTAEQKKQLQKLRTQQQNNVDLLQVKNKQFENIRKNYRATGTDNKADAEQQSIRDRVDCAKAFMLVKYLEEDLFNKQGAKLTHEEKLIKDYINSTEIVVDKKHKEFIPQKEKKSNLTRKERKYFNKSFKSGSLFSKLKGLGKKSRAVSSVSTRNAYSTICEMEKAVPEVVDLETESDIAPSPIGIEQDGTNENNPTEPKTKPEPKRKAKPANTEERKTKNLTVDQVKNLSVEQAENAVIQVCRAMEKLQSLTTGKGVYGKNDMADNIDEVERLKEVFEYNKNVLKAVINKTGKFNKALYNRYAADINKAGMRYKEYMSIVENKTVRL